jgi:hypothetical protein
MHWTWTLQPKDIELDRDGNLTNQIWEIMLSFDGSAEHSCIEMPVSSGIGEGTKLTALLRLRQRVLPNSSAILRGTASLNVRLSGSSKGADCLSEPIP